MVWRLLLASGLVAYWASPARALCTYHGVDNVKTTLVQEFRDSRWVVRAHVVSADYHWSDEDESWVRYRLRVVENFKGRLPQRFAFFTQRNSGGFYMDGKDAAPDMDGDYLLFLVRLPRRSTDPTAARDALWVNYNCGQSRPWAEVKPAEAKQLRVLSRSRRQS